MPIMVEGSITIERNKCLGGEGISLAKLLTPNNAAFDNIYICTLTLF